MIYAQLALFSVSIVGILVEIVGTYARPHNSPTGTIFYRTALYATLGGMSWLLGQLM